MPRMPKRKRGAGEGTIFRRQNGRWVAEMTLPGGKRRTMYAKTRREAAERLADAQARLRAMLPITSADDITVAEYLRRWLVERCESRLAPRTVLSYRGHVERQIIPSLGDIRLSALSPGDVTRMMDRWLATGLDNDTVARLRLILSSALGAAMQAELLTRNVAKLAQAPRATPRRVQALSADQVVAIAEAVRGTSAEGFATLALYAGLRRGEVLGLSWADVDLDKGVVTVRHQLQQIGSEWVLTPPKTAAGERRVPLPVQARAALVAQRAEQERLRAALGDAWPDTGLVFTTSTGHPLTGRDAARKFHRALTLAGLPLMRFHDLRHAYATMLIAVGTHPRVVMELLGHSTIRVTMDIYGHVAEDTARTAIDNLSAALAAASVQQPRPPENQGGTGDSPTSEA